MIVVSQTVPIAASPARVFALLADPLVRFRLHPEATPLRAEVEGGGALQLNSRCTFRLQLSTGVVEYRTRIIEFEENRRIVSRVESALPFEICMEVMETNKGARLSQTETFEPTEAMLETALPSLSDRSVWRWLQSFLPFLDAEYAQALRERQAQALKEKLEGRLSRWLTAIKNELEK